MSNYDSNLRKSLDNYYNWRASQNALQKMPKDVKTKGPGRHDRRALLSTIAVVAALIVAVILLGWFGII